MDTRNVDGSKNDRARDHIMDAYYKLVRDVNLYAQRAVLARHKTEVDAEAAVLFKAMGLFLPK